MKRERRLRNSRGRPFWLPAPTYYFLTIGIALVVFFLAWAILAEAKEESPWIAAGLVGSSTMIAGVLVREVVLRNRRRSIFAAQRRLDDSVLSIPVAARRVETKKLTLEQNSILLTEIQRKAAAAGILGHFAESHREVFELCAQYIEVATRELPNIGVGSPRLAAIKRGRDEAEKLHREHILRWAEIEIRKNTAELQNEEYSTRLKGALNALSTVDSALQHYPDDSKLVATRDAIATFVNSMSVVDLIKRSKYYEDQGDLESALSCLIEARDLIDEDPFAVDDDNRSEVVLAGIERLSARDR